MDSVELSNIVTGVSSSSATDTLNRVAMSLNDVAVSFSGRTAVRDVTFDVTANKVTSIIGPSGSGKTTLLRAFNRLHDLTKGAVVTGEIKLGPVDIYNGGLATTLLRSRIGMVFQRPNPFPTMSIYDNVVSGLRFHGIRKKSDRISTMAVSPRPCYEVVSAWSFSAQIPFLRCQSTTTWCRGFVSTASERSQIGYLQWRSRHAPATKSYRHGLSAPKSLSYDVNLRQRGVGASFQRHQKEVIARRGRRVRSSGGGVVGQRVDAHEGPRRDP